VVFVDATGFVGCVVNSAKEEWLVADRQLIETVQGRAHDHVSFHEVARATHVRHGRTVAKRSRLVAHVIKGVQRKIEEELFLFNLALVGHLVLVSILKIEKFQV
jgi:hypothetical protein